MRRLVVLTSTIIAVDAMLFTALAPLIPGYAAEFDLGKGGAGLLVGAFGAGALIGGVASGFAAARFGPKPMVVVGLCVLGVASFAFAFAGGPWTLGASRFVQGLASTATWAGALAWVTVRAPSCRRGEIIGLVFGFAIAGAVVGPMFGAVAHAIGIRVSFAAVGGAALVMAAVAAASQAGPRESQEPGALGRALHDPRYVGALWLNTLPALLFGVAGRARPARSRRTRLLDARDRARLLRRRAARGRPQPGRRPALRPSRPARPHPLRARRLGRDVARARRCRIVGRRRRRLRRRGRRLRQLLHAREWRSGRHGRPGPGSRRGSPSAR